MNIFVSEQLENYINNNFDDVKDLSTCVTPEYLKLQKIDNYIHFPPQSLVVTEPLSAKESEGVENLALTHLKIQKTQLEIINNQLQRAIKEQELNLHNLEFKKRIIQSQLELAQGYYSLAQKKIELRIVEIKKIVEIRKILEGNLLTSPERLKLIGVLNKLTGKNIRRTQDLLAKQKALQEHKTASIRDAQKNKEEKDRELLDLDLQRQKAITEKSILESRLAKNQRVLDLNQAQQETFMARQVFTQAQIELELARESEDLARIKNTETSLQLATEALQTNINRVNLCSKQLKFAQYLVTELEKQRILQTEIEKNARATLDLKQQVNQLQRKADDIANSMT